MGLGRETIQRLKKLVVEDFSPDLTLIMDLQVEEGLRRTEKRFGGRNRYDEMDFQFHKKVRDGFLEIASTIKAQAPPVTKKMLLQFCFSKKAAMYSAPVTRIL